VLYRGPIDADHAEGLHMLGRVVGDISPDLIEFSNPSAVLEPYYDCYTSSFAMKVRAVVSLIS